MLHYVILDNYTLVGHYFCVSSSCSVACCNFCIKEHCNFFLFCFFQTLKHIVTVSVTLFARTSYSLIHTYLIMHGTSRRYLQTSQRRARWGTWRRHRSWRPIRTWCLTAPWAQPPAGRTAPWHSWSRSSWSPRGRGRPASAAGDYWGDARRLAAAGFGCGPSWRFQYEMMWWMTEG